MTRAEKIRQDIEDQIFGANVARHPGFAVGGMTVERGSGSPFAMLPDSVRARIEAADDLIAAECAEWTAAEELKAATVKHKRAVAAVAAALRKVGESNASA